MSTWEDPEKWRTLVSGQACPICLNGGPLGIIAELETSYVTADEDMPVNGYCCLVLKRHAVELHDLAQSEAASLMADMCRVSQALQYVTGAIKINVEIHGNKIPHLHAHFFPRYVGDPFEDGPIDLRRTAEDNEVTYARGEFPHFVRKLQSALNAD